MISPCQLNWFIAANIQSMLVDLQFSSHKLNCHARVPISASAHQKWKSAHTRQECGLRGRLQLKCNIQAIVYDKKPLAPNSMGSEKISHTLCEIDVARAHTEEIARSSQVCVYFMYFLIRWQLLIESRRRKWHENATHASLARRRLQIRS